MSNVSIRTSQAADSPPPLNQRPESYKKEILITALAIIAISAIIMGILTLLAPSHNGLSGLNFLGTKGGASLISVGGITLLAGVFGACFSNKKQETTHQPTQDLGQAVGASREQQHPIIGPAFQNPFVNPTTKTLIYKMMDDGLITMGQALTIDYYLDKATFTLNPSKEFNSSIEEGVKLKYWTQEEAHIIIKKLITLLHPDVEPKITRLANKEKFIAFYKGGILRF